MTISDTNDTDHVIAESENVYNSLCVCVCARACKNRQEIGNTIMYLHSYKTLQLWWLSFIRSPSLLSLSSSLHNKPQKLEFEKLTTAYIWIEKLIRKNIRCYNF